MPTDFYVSNPDDSLIDLVTDAEWLTSNPRLSALDLTNQFRTIRSLQDRFWDLRKPTSHGTIVGGSGDMKWVASIPKNVALAAEAVAAAQGFNFWEDTYFYAWLRRNPQYTMTPSGTTR